MDHRNHRLLELGTLAALLLQVHRALIWVVHTWTAASYESWGFVALLALAAGLRRLPPRRPRPSLAHLAGLTLTLLLDLALAPLGIHVLAAALALVGLHLWLVTFRAYSGAWLLHPQLWLGLLCLPVVHWANVLCGYQVQRLVSRLAAAVLGLYGLSAHAEGTLLRLPGAVLAVDASCSGLKLLYSGVLLGLILTAGGAARWPRRLLFWGALAALLLGANVVRVISLAMAQLQLGHPVSDAAHQAIGLVAFVMVCGASLLLWRRLREAAPCPA